MVIKDFEMSGFAHNLGIKSFIFQSGAEQPQKMIKRDNKAKDTT